MAMVNPVSEAVLRDRRRPLVADVRGDYFRDQTAILHSLDFRRLKRKTQVFFDPDNDHVCTRLEHVLHVSTIAATICRGLGLDVDLAQAIGLGHDIGHAPFGHAGERVLARTLAPIGGFVHELHGLRVVDCIAGGGEGLNLTWAVRDGIASHCGERWEQALSPATEPKDLGALVDRGAPPATWEGCVVRVSDKVAYLGRDIEDAITARLITVVDLPDLLRVRVGTSNGAIIDTLVLDVIATAERTGCIGFSDELHEVVLTLRDFNYQRIYRSAPIVAYQQHCTEILDRLVSHLLEVFDRGGLDPAAYRDDHDLERWFGRYVASLGPAYQRRGEVDGYRVVGDYVAGMTDDFALRCFRDLVLPRPLHFR